MGGFDFQDPVTIDRHRALKKFFKKQN
jgi:hypothetical protein